MRTRPELLAPAGNVESFFAAVENGADAVYLGLKKFSARATAANFSIDELSTLIAFAHKRGVRVYPALNSQISPGELPEVLDTLNSLSALQPDGLIVQDAGIFYLVRRHFPNLRLHASTLACAHNSAGVKVLERMGAQRVILARELSLQDIEKICSETSVELEMFIHGALCYSYSGLCIASSFRGGRSGLRGECVQPCRLKFRQGRKEGFFLSCNDLCALPLIPKLKRLRIAAFKIEGRMKPADYVGTVVGAYRSVLDAEPGREENEALLKAKELLSTAPSRRLTSGHLEETGIGAVLTPHRSGSSGSWCATVKRAAEGRILVDLRHPVAKGDRLRPESTSGKEERAFSVSEIFDSGGKSISSAPGGVSVYLAGTLSLSPGARLFKVGTKSASALSIWEKIRGEASPGDRLRPRFPMKKKILEDLGKTPDVHPPQGETLVLKVASASDATSALRSSAKIVLIEGGKSNLEQIAKQRFTPANLKRLGFSLPPVISGGRDLDYYRAAIRWFINKGFTQWEINNWGHFDLTGEGRGLRLMAGARLNLRNAAAVAEVLELGCSWAVLSLEATEEELSALARESSLGRLILLIYSWPPLFTSPLVPGVDFDRPFLSARNEAYYSMKKAGRVEIFADRPVSLLERLPLLRSLGYCNFLIEAGGGPPKRGQSPEAVLNAYAACRSPGKCSLFNFERKPQL